MNKDVPLALVFRSDRTRNEVFTKESIAAIARVLPGYGIWHDSQRSTIALQKCACGISRDEVHAIGQIIDVQFVLHASPVCSELLAKIGSRFIPVRAS